MAVRRGKTSFDDGTHRDLVDLAGRGQLRAVATEASRFLESLRYRDSRGGLGPTGVAQLDELMPGWRTLTPREIDYGWYIRHDLPVPAWDDDYIGLLLEGRLGETGEAGEEWLGATRQAININAARGTLDYLDQTFPGWRTKSISRLDKEARKREANKVLIEERKLAKAERRTSLRKQSDRFIAAAKKGRLAEQIEANDWLAAMRELEIEHALTSDEIDALNDAAPSWRLRSASRLDRDRFPDRPAPKPDSRRVTTAHLLTTRLARLAAVWPDGPFDPADRTWLNLQRSLLNTGKLSDDAKAQITAALPGWEDPGTIAHVRAVPVRRNAGDGGAETRKRFLKLAEQGNLTLNARAAQRWLSSERKREAAGELAPEVIKQLDTVAPGWRTTGPQGLDRATKLALSPQDPTMVEAARWARLHLQADSNRWLRSKRDEDERGVMDKKVRAGLDEYVPEWRVRSAAFLDRHRAKALLSAPVSKPDEAFLTLIEGNHIDAAGAGVKEWLDRLRAQADRGGVPDAVAYRLDALMPDWRRA